MQSKQHWETVYASKNSDEVSWFQEHAQLSLNLIRNHAIPLTASILDVGGGASTLVDDLLADGYSEITVLDISGAALAKTKARLGINADSVHWLEADILDTPLPADTYEVWHDRAVFHFLVQPAARQLYLESLYQSVKPGGIVIMATFAEDGPMKCSGLPVARYSAAELSAEFGEKNYKLLSHTKEIHHTPGGNDQKFTYCVFERI